MKKKPNHQFIPIEFLSRGKYQPRQHFDQEQLQELAESIKTTNGLIQPIVVRPKSKDVYEIIAGERRWRAAQLAGLTQVACLVSDYTDEEALQTAIIENINRSNLNPIEEAKGYLRLIEEFGYIHDEVAATVCKSRTSVTNSLRLLKCDERVQAYIVQGELSEGHGKILASIDLKKQHTIAMQCIQKKWSVRKLETEIKKILSDTVPSPYSDTNVKNLETALSDHVGNKVNLRYANLGGGQIQIQFNNIDELEGLFKKIGFEFEADLDK